ncbi:MAG TPA: ribonuclease D [Kineosporiaceae bacterium]|nr:ribonuclease D [Kineosporiaceae bacterium]
MPEFRAASIPAAAAVKPASIPAAADDPDKAAPEDVSEATSEALPEGASEALPEAESAVQEAAPRQRLDFPRDGVPPVIVDRAALAEVIAAMAAGTGPIAVDAERASGHRYGQRAFLVQLRREGAGTALIDPVELPDLSDLNHAIAGVEWVLHAASQDLPCLAEVGLHPTILFDTELGGRLAGYPRVGLAAMVEELLGLSLAKEHSAVDWSTRPLPEPWLRYAALDVEVLTDLRDAVHTELERQGKLAWAQEEFAAVAAAPPPPPRVDPWRRTSGMHRVRDRRRLAGVRELWTARDAVARQRDLSPGRILPDSAIVEAALAMPTSMTALNALPAFSGRGARRHTRQWLDALDVARALPDAELPPQHLPTDGPPPPRVWAERDPMAAARLAAARAAIAELGGSLELPVENLLAPDTVRRLCWDPPESMSQEAIEQVLRGLGARQWQIDLTAAVLTGALKLAAAGLDDEGNGA